MEKEQGAVGVTLGGKQIHHCPTKTAPYLCHHRLAPQQSVSQLKLSETAVTVATLCSDRRA